jgi:hypothetical protein
MSLLGSGSAEVFYLDNLEKGIKEYVVDKDRKKALEADMAEYTEIKKDFDKKRKAHLKELVKKNSDRNTSKEWYEDFYKKRMDERRELQSFSIDKRLDLQQKIHVNEWEDIIISSKVAYGKAYEKAEKKAAKKGEEDLFEDLNETIEETITDVEKKTAALEAVADFKSAAIEITQGYQKINIEDSEFLRDRNATRAQMQKVCDDLNALRVEMHNSYMTLINSMKENTNSDQWAPVSKELNKLIKP